MANRPRDPDQPEEEDFQNMQEDPSEIQGSGDRSPVQGSGDRGPIQGSGDRGPVQGSGDREL